MDIDSVGVMMFSRDRGALGAARLGNLEPRRGRGNGGPETWPRELVRIQPGVVDHRPTSGYEQSRAKPKTPGTGPTH